MKPTVALTATDSYWSQQAFPRFRRVTAAQTFDADIVGAGITGATTAYLLKREGLNVALLDRGAVGGHDTPCTSAHLTCVTDTPLSDLVQTFGEDHARAAWDAGLAAINEIDEIVRRQQIDCDFAWVPGYFHAPADTRDDAHTQFLRDEAALANRLGFDAELLEHVPFLDVAGVELRDQARIHPLKYLRALLADIDGEGSAVFEHTDVSEVAGDPLAVTAGGHELRCGHLIVATHNPIVGKASWVSATLLQTKLALYTSYVIAGRVPAGSVPDALFWDTANPYRYLRVEPHDGHDVVIYGGEDHKTGQASDTRECFARLEARLRAIAPNVDVTHRWSGQVIETPDGLPYIGEMSPRQFVATGFAGNGLTFGTVGAMMARDAVLGRPNPWAKLFDVGRKKLSAVWDYLKENKDYPYYIVRDRFAGAEGRSIRSLPRGTGKVLELSGQKVAAYRAPDGEVTKRSAICTHMGCLVQWNIAEGTWDCPCHGSRFKATGEVLAGPAESELSPIEKH